jgi:hypothetical protein
VLSEPASAPAAAVEGKPAATRWNVALLAGISAATIAYLYLLATDTVDGLRGNAQWHIPYVAHPSNDHWWLPLIPGAIIAALPLLPLPDWATVGAGMCAACAFAYDLFAAQWGGGDNLMAKIINEPVAFHRAAGKITDLGAVLANYPRYIAGFEPSSHLRSHPPGDLLLFRWLEDLMQASAGLRDATLGWGRTFVGGTDMLLQAGNAPYLMAAAVAAIPLIVGLGRLAAAPLAGLTARLGGRVAPASLLFLVLPTTLVHIPLLDTVYPLLTGLILLVGVVAIQRARGWVVMLLAGALLGGGMVYSAAVGIVALPLALYGVLRGGWRMCWLALPAVAGAALVWLGLWLAWGINMPAILQFLAQHQRDFEATRSYWLWFRWKWYDFVMFCGIPVAALNLKFLVESVRRWRKGVPLRLDYFFAGWLLMMIVLWLSTATMAESGRLWAPVMCFSVLFAARALPRLRGALSFVLLLEIAQVMVINRYLEVVNSG